jgi:hypothetical protein
MSTPVAWTRLQVRRLLWVAKDVVLCLRSLADAMRWARRIDEPVAIALLEGEAVACAGRPNWYRIRVANGSPNELLAELMLYGESASAAPLDLRCDQRLAPRAASDVYLATDWAGHAETAPERPPPDGVAALLVPPPTGVCRLVAVLRSGDHVLDEIAIIQPLASCTSST